MYVIYAKGTRYLWDETSKKLMLGEELVGFAANAARARELALSHQAERVDV